MTSAQTRIKRGVVRRAFQFSLRLTEGQIERRIHALHERESTHSFNGIDFEGCRAVQHIPSVIRLAKQIFQSRSILVVPIVRAAPVVGRRT